METLKTYSRNKGGRPRKAVKKDQVITIKCSLNERKAIESRAAIAGLSVSEYLREIGLDGKIVSHKKVLPKEVLSLTASLNHLAANINQIARRRNGIDELNPIERANLKVQSLELKELAMTIKTHMK